MIQCVVDSGRGRAISTIQALLTDRRSADWERFSPESCFTVRHSCYQRTWAGEVKQSYSFTKLYVFYPPLWHAAWDQMTMPMYIIGQI